MRVVIRLAASLFVCALLAGCSKSQGSKKTHFDNGENFRASGKIQEAIVEYQNALREDPNYAEARFALAKAHETAGNRTEAYKAFMSAAELMPASAEAQIEAARYLVAVGSFADARTRLEPVLDADPANSKALLTLGSALVGLHDLDGAVFQIEEAIRLQPGVPAFSSLAFIKMEQGDKATALSSFQKAIEADPASIGARLALAYFHWSNDDLEAAERAYRSALVLDGKNSLTNRSIIVFYTGTNRPHLAEPFLKAMAATGEKEAVFQLADFYLSLERTAEAAALIAPLAKDSATQGDVEVRLAAIAYATNDPAGGHALLDKVRGREPGKTGAHLMKARWLMLEQKPKAALEAAQAAVKSSPGSAEAHFTLGLVQNELRLRAEATKTFSDVVRLNPRAARAQLYLSRLNLVAGKPDAAVTLAESALSTTPDDPQARLGLVQGLLARRDTARAEAELATLLKEYPQSAIVHALAARSRGLKNDLAGARSEYVRALELSPNLIEALAGLTALDISQNRAAEARARVERALASRPDNVELLMLAGQVYGAMGDFAKAEASLRKVIERDSGTSRAYTIMATVLVASGKLDEGLAEFDRIWQRDTSNIGARIMSAMILHAQGKLGDAKKRYEEVISLSPNAAVASNNLAWIYQDENTKLDDALRLAEGAVGRVPNNAAYHDTVGMIQLKKDQLAPAVTAFERSVALAPDNATYHYHLAMALARSGDPRAARESAQRALQLRPNFPEAQRLLTQTPG